MDAVSIIKARTYPALSPGSNRNIGPLIPNFPGKYYRDDLEYLVQLSVQQDIFGEEWLEFRIRVLWLKARFLMHQGQTDFAVDCFDKITSLLKIETENNAFAIRLHNCKLDNVITLEHVQKQLESLQRCQSLEEVHRLYESGEYQQVVDLLTATFHQYQASGKFGNFQNLSERHAQLQLLQDSLFKLDDYEKCLYWGEVAFNEALQQYSFTSSKTSKTNWFETMTYLLTSLEKCLSHDATLLKFMEKSNLVRFAQNLIRVITIQLESLEFVNNAKDTIVFPWILLYRLINHEENKIRALFSKKSSKENSPLIKDVEQVEADFGPGVPSSLMLLYNAHEFLGRRAWCCNSDGRLLLLYVDVLLKELGRYNEQPHPYKEDLEVSLEQCFYCLYCHPHKRTRSKHLQEHNAAQVPLTWERAVAVFNYFKPKQTPEFDSHKASTVSTELEVLLRRIIALVPSQDDPANNLDKVMSFIEGTADELPQLTEKEKSLPIVDELYYLLADFYFKNKEFSKAIRYYTLDICVNPGRLDSWAGMALARSSQLEQKLNSCELKNEGAIYRKSKAALCCFQRALEIDETNTTLWIEYGSASYMLHSHASRQLKQKEQFCLTSEVIESLKVKRTEMLQTAKLCFQSANQCSPITGDEEEWLHHYMLGKISEKLNMPVINTLFHFEKAANHLHEKEARYPRRIQYHNPPDFAMEALEVYYRMHAACLKYLMKCDEKSLPLSTCEELHKYLKRASESPFALFQEKSRYSSLSSSDVDEPMAPPPGEHTKYQFTTSINSDHDYFRRKRKDSSAEDSETEPRLRHSVDSSSESFDSATVKDILNSILAVVTERNPNPQASENVLLVLGDARIKKTPPNNEKTALKTGNFSEIKDNVDPRKHDNSIGTGYQLQNVDQEKLASSTGSQSESMTDDNVSEATVVFRPQTSQSYNQEEAKKLEDAVDKGASNSLNNSSKTTQGQTEPTTEVVANGEKEDTDKAKQIPTYGELIDMSIAAMKQCLQRFPQHYKSLYRLAYYYSHTSQRKNLHWSRDFLLGRKVGWQQLPHMPCQGLFSERKNTNLFNGIWRIPNEDIDRPGSFGSHMYRSVVLLIEVLKQLKDYNFLINLTLQLHRNPDTGKKFLRDMDRLYLYGLTQDITMTSLRSEMKRLCDKERTPENNEKIVKHLLIIYRAWHNYLKCASNPDMVNKLLENAYRLYKQNECDKLTPILEQAIKFCQMQISFSKLPKIISMPQTESSRLSYPGLSNLSQVESNRLLYSNLPHYITNDRKSLSTGNELGSIMDQHAWRTEALENAAKLLLSPGESKSDIRKLKEKSELSIKSINAGGVPLLKEKPASSGSSPISRDIIDKVINEKPGAHQQQAAISNSNGKMAWNTSNIPASGMVIGSMTIMPVGTNSPPAQAEGLLGRLAGTRPKSPLDLSSGDSKKTTVPTTKSSSMFPSFDPSRLTADVQSKISSLDPIEQASRSNISGFQMEFMRQIAQRQQLSISRSNSTKVPSQRNPSTYSQKSTSHQAWGSCAPIGIATSNSSHSKLSSTSNTKGTLSSKMPSSQLLESNKALSSTSSSSVLKDGSIKHASSGVKETSTKYGTATNMQTTLSKDGSTKNSQPSSSPARQSVIQKDMSAKSSSSTTARLTVAKDGFPSKSSPPSSASLSKEPTSVNMASHTVHSLIAKDSGVIKSSSVSGNLKEMTSKKVVVHSAPTTKDLMEATVKLTDIAASMKIPHCLSTVKTIDRSISLNNPSKLDVSSAAKSSLSVSNLEGLPSNPQSLVKPCYVQLRSIRIHSSTQDSTKRLVPVLTRCEDPSMTKSDNSKASDALSSSNHGNSQK